MIAALYVATGGVYYNLPNVKCWDEYRDARYYSGPYRVIAHPPCERWGRYWHGGPSAKIRQLRGDDGGCFKIALSCVRKWGGVLEHPADSSAWTHFGISKPPRIGGWVKADNFGGWTCCVYQGHYGHRAQKATWLYACGIRLPQLVWGKSKGIRLDNGFHTAEERRRKIRTDICQLLSHVERKRTPIKFRDLLISMVSD